MKQKKMKQKNEKLKSHKPDFDSNRSCTDIFWLILFIFFLGGWGYLGYYSMSKGDLKKLYLPIDSNNKICGEDPGLLEKKYLGFLEFTECLSSDIAASVTGCGKTVCIEKCPDKTVYFKLEMLKSRTKFNELKSAMICTEDINIKTMDADEALDHISNGKCAEYVIHSKPVLGRCFPMPNMDGVNNKTTKSSSKQVMPKILADLENSKWYMTGAMLCMVLICFIYIFLLKWVISPLVWGTIGFLFVVLGYGMYMCYTNMVYYKEHPEKDHFLLKILDLGPPYKAWRIILIGLGIATVIILLLLLFLRSRIVIAIALIREGSKAVTAIKSTVFFPIFPLMIHCLVLAYALLVFVALTTIKDPYIVAEKLIYLKLANVFAFFWSRAFVSGVADMILACTFSLWYWTLNKRSLPFFALTSGIHKTFRYHLGTVALGSLIISIVQIVKFIWKQMSRRTKINKVIPSCVMCLCRCFFNYLEKALKFINKNAYIMCAMRGTNFCKSASAASSLLIRNIVRVVVLDKVTDFIFLLSKLVMSVGVGVGVYYLLEWDYLYKATSSERLHYNYVPAVVLGVATYLMCTIFFDVYSMAVDTLFLCFLEDSEKNDGSPEKPYYMSKNLMKILGKKNTKEEKREGKSG